MMKMIFGAIALALPFPPPPRPLGAMGLVRLKLD